ncbi:MAG TPA: TetR/AcrR family transcriptional regulator [Solirubrobacteraceae bacterium]|nr:TetR/AcrR family transcriptional regulator [Solirubrobacteraceae bacterium]
MSAHASTSETGILTVLPRGRHAAPRPVVREAQRARMLAAMVQAVAEKGYARVAVADVIERAGVSRKTFYEQFANKDECFLAAYDASVDELLAKIDEALDAIAPDWLTAHRAAVETYLQTLAASPELARALLIEVLGAGHEALSRRAAVQDRFAAQLEDVHRRARNDIPEIPEVPPHTYLAAVGAVNELVTAHVLEHGAETLPELADAIVDVQLALLVGRQVAAELVARSG